MSDPIESIEPISADDLAMLASGFEALMLSSPAAGAADADLFELGWADVLSVDPASAAAMAFTALGTTGAAAGLIDDVVVHALGIEPSLDLCVVLPAAGGAVPPAHRDGDVVVIDGVVSARAVIAGRALVPLPSLPDPGRDHHDMREKSDPDRRKPVVLLSVDISDLRLDTPNGLDPSGAFRRVQVTLPAGANDPAETNGDWRAAMAAARVALAHQLVAASRLMLDQARQHALDRVQFGRAVSSFQAVRHRLAESLVHIEGAAAALDVWGTNGDPLHAMLAKSLAGKAARATAAHAQQVLAGIGFTTDHPFQLTLKRVLTVDSLLGSAASLPSEIGYELLARRGAPRLVEL